MRAVVRMMVQWSLIGVLSVYTSTHVGKMAADKVKSQFDYVNSRVEHALRRR